MTILILIGILLVITGVITIYLLKKYSEIQPSGKQLFLIILIALGLSLIVAPIVEYLPFVFIPIQTYLFSDAIFVSPLIVIIISILLAIKRSPYAFIVFGTMISFGLLVSYVGLTEKIQVPLSIPALVGGLIGFAMNIVGLWKIWIRKQKV